MPGRTRTETLRFLRAYLPWGLSPLSDWKSVWRATEQRHPGQAGTQPAPGTSPFLTPNRWEPERDHANLDCPIVEPQPLGVAAGTGVRCSSRLVSLVLLSRLRDPGGPRADAGSHPVPAQDRPVPGLLEHAHPGRVSRRSAACTSLETDLASRLGYRPRPGEDPVEIYVLNDRNAYRTFSQVLLSRAAARGGPSSWPRETARVVYTYLSDRLEEDLRHEATHALLRGCYGDLPLWLDEGLAEYFETRTDIVDAQDEHLAKIPEDLKNGWMPDLPRLESLTDIHQMTPRDYREAWAWVHLMLDGAGPPGTPCSSTTWIRAARPHAVEDTPLARCWPREGTTSKSLLAHLEAMESPSWPASPSRPRRAA